ncbi:MAG TPA: ABC transporter substrate-binding protein [Bacteroidia bacterium]|nr:ABC transporter substrate-binding protein [Bacteroidia bacterium]
MKFSRFSFLLAAPVLLLFSCSDQPQGKFTENKKGDTASNNIGVKFVHNPSTTQWQKDWSTDNVVVYHWRAEPDNLHPSNGQSNPRRVVMDYTQRFLVSTDFEKQSIRPDLIKSMPTVSPDGLRYDYELRDEPVWDDGTPLTADDVEFSMKAFLCPYTEDGFAKPYFETLAGFEKDASNPKKFTVICSRKYIQNVALFGDLTIMERKYYDPKNVLGNYSLAQMNDPAFVKTMHADLKTWADEFNSPKYGTDPQSMQGLGAYKVQQWDKGQRIILVKKKNHWTSKVQNPNMYDAAYPDQIIFQINTDDNSIALQLKNQKIDVSTWIQTHSLIELQQDTNFNRNYFSAFVPNFNYQYLGMNLKPEASNRLPFFTDKRVRHAMALLIPADQMNQAYLDGKAIRMTSLVSPMKPDIYNTSLKPVPFNIDSAKTLLDEAGWKDSDNDNIRDKMIDGKKVPFKFELLIMTGNPVVPKMANDIKDAMHKAGIEVTITSLEFGAFYNQVMAHQFDMYMGAWASASGPEDYKQIWSSTSWENKGSNYVGFGTPATDSLIEKIRVTIDDSARTPMIKQLQQMVYDEEPYVFLYSVPSKIAIHRRFDHADMYYDKPGVFLSNLKLLTPGNMMKPAPVQ